jgi:hypothetical protein
LVHDILQRHHTGSGDLRIGATEDEMQPESLEPSIPPILSPRVNSIPVPTTSDAAAQAESQSSPPKSPSDKVIGANIAVLGTPVVCTAGQQVSLSPRQDALGVDSSDSIAISAQPRNSSRLGSLIVTRALSVPTKAPASQLSRSSSPGPHSPQSKVAPSHSSSMAIGESASPHRRQRSPELLKPLLPPSQSCPLMVAVVEPSFPQPRPSPPIQHAPQADPSLSCASSVDLVEPVSQPSPPHPLPVPVSSPDLPAASDATASALSPGQPACIVPVSSPEMQAERVTVALAQPLSSASTVAGPWQTWSANEFSTAEPQQMASEPFAQRPQSRSIAVVRSAMPVHMRRVRFDASADQSHDRDRSTANQKPRAVYSARSRFSRSALSAIQAHVAAAAMSRRPQQEPINISVAKLKSDSPNERVLVDQLQYILDGIFPGEKAGYSSSDPTLGDTESRLLCESLVELAQIFLRMSPHRLPALPVHSELGTDRTDPVEHQESSLLLRLYGKRGILSTVITRLLALRARSTPVALLIGTIMLVLSRSDAAEVLFDNREVAALVDVFFRVLPALDHCLETRSVQAHFAPSGGTTGRSNVTMFDTGHRRRGRLARRIGTSSLRNSVIERVRSLLVDGCGVEYRVAEGITEDGRGVGLVFGLALSGVLERNELARCAMSESQRVNRIVAVLSESQRLLVQSLAPYAVAGPVAGIALRILELTTLNRPCQRLVTRDKRLVGIIVSILRPAPSKRDTRAEADHLTRAEDMEQIGAMSLLHDEIAITNALKVCVNLTHECKAGLLQFIAAGGVSVVLDLLASSSIWPTGLGRSDSRESFDIRVLSIALLASIVEQSPRVCASFKDIHLEFMEPREGGAVTLVLEMLKAVGGNQDARMSRRIPNSDIADVTTSASLARGNCEPIDLTKGSEKEQFSPPEFHESASAQSDEGTIAMERRVTTGYLCLLLGALVKGCARNRELALAAMPEHSLSAVAEVLDEFLMFHHELGVVSTSVDAMYESIIAALRHSPAIDDEVLVVEHVRATSPVSSAVQHGRARD